MGHAFYSSAVDEQDFDSTCFAVGSTYTEHLLGWYWQLYWHSCTRKLIHIRGGQKKPQNQNPKRIWVRSSRSVPPLLPDYCIVQIQTEIWVAAQEKLWLREESGCECCQLSPSSINTVYDNCSDLFFMRFVTCSYSAEQGQDLFILNSVLTLISHKRGQESEFLQQYLLCESHSANNA